MADCMLHTFYRNVILYFVYINIIRKLSFNNTRSDTCFKLMISRFFPKIKLNMFAKDNGVFLLLLNKYR